MNAKSNYGFTALIWAAINGHLDVVKALIEARAIVNAKDNQGRTALDLAKQNHKNDVVELLMQHERNIGVETNANMVTGNH